MKKIILILISLTSIISAKAEYYNCELKDSPRTEIVVFQNDDKICSGPQSICLQFAGKQVVEGVGSFNDDTIEFAVPSSKVFLTWDFDSNSGFYRNIYNVSKAINCDYNYQQ